MPAQGKALGMKEIDDYSPTDEERSQAEFWVGLNRKSERSEPILLHKNNR